MGTCVRTCDVRRTLLPDTSTPPRKLRSTGTRKEGPLIRGLQATEEVVGTRVDIACPRRTVPPRTSAPATAEAPGVEGSTCGVETQGPPGLPRGTRVPPDNGATLMHPGTPHSDYPTGPEVLYSPHPPSGGVSPSRPVPTSSPSRHPPGPGGDPGRDGRRDVCGGRSSTGPPWTTLKGRRRGPSSSTRIPVPFVFVCSRLVPGLKTRPGGSSFSSKFPVSVVNPRTAPVRVGSRTSGPDSTLRPNMYLGPPGLTSPLPGRTGRDSRLVTSPTEPLTRIRCWD